MDLRLLYFVHELSHMNLIDCLLPDVGKQINNKHQSVNKLRLPVMTAPFWFACVIAGPCLY